jgi:hypothetical protein
VWPFTKKEPKPDWCDEGIAALKAFRDVGQTFSYLGRTCIVTGHWEWMGIDFGPRPVLLCDYADDRGEIRQLKFNLSELPALEAQNCRVE